MNKEAQQAFEKACRDWGFDFEKDESGAYMDYATGSSFGLFLMGWRAKGKQ